MQSCARPGSNNEISFVAQHTMVGDSSRDGRRLSGLNGRENFRRSAACTLIFLVVPVGLDADAWFVADH